MSDNHPGPRDSAPAAEESSIVDSEDVLFAHGGPNEDHVGAWDRPSLLFALFGARTPKDADSNRPRRSESRRDAASNPAPSRWPPLFFRKALRLLGALKEPFSAASHLTGAALSVVALLLLLLAAHGRPLHMISFALYGASLIALFSASGLYHSIRCGPNALARLQRLDYMAIYLLIAGTYAPVCLVGLRGAWGWSLFGIEYALAFLGIAAVIFLRRRFPEWMRVALCAGMTWLILAAIAPLCRALPVAAVGWLLAGLIIYTLGTLILATDRPHLLPGRFSAHDLWHLFVLAGSACHFILVLCYIGPAK